MQKLTNILVTGAAGFTSSNFILLLFSKKEFTGNIINLDKLTYGEYLKDFVSDPRLTKS
jgi:dTDP-D-glucose 4,6-dehydratase